MKEKVRDIEYYYKKNRFFNLVLDTKKHRNLWKSKEALFSFILSSIIVLMLSVILQDKGSILTQEKITNFMEMVRPIILTILGGCFSLLGFTISGLALLTGTIGTDVISKIREDSKIQHLVSVIFNFYFCGVIIGVTALVSLITYVLTYVDIQFNLLIFYIWALLYCYLIVFSIIYSVMLLGTSIRLFLLKYFYITKDNNEKTP